jgi:cyclopropane fatty-acyl-phospholipid synthase-like methyltransferase
MEKREYVHGYSERERARLHDQANTLTELLHGDTRYPPGSIVLEAGCGVGLRPLSLRKIARKLIFYHLSRSKL